MASKVQGIIQKINPDGGSTVYSIAPTVYGYCETAANTAAKTVDMTGFTNDNLVEGTTIFVKFKYANTASSPTLKVGSADAKNLYQYGTTKMGTTDANGGWYANSVMCLTYDGSGWVRTYTTGNTEYTNLKLGQGYGTCTTAESTTAKVGIMSSYELTTGGIVAIKFTYAVPASSTLNINSKGAKAIYYRGAAIPAGKIKAGDTAYFMYNSYYHLLGVDRIEDIPTKTSDLTNDSGFITASDIPTCSINWDSY